MIKAIIFDCFGVLTANRWATFLDSLPEGTDFKTIREIHRSYDAGLITKEECSGQIKELSGSEFVEIEDVSSIETTKNIVLIDYIKKLENRYTIGIISNISSNWIRDELLTEEEQKLFDVMVFSYEVGFVKPDHRIFELACRKLGVEYGEVVFLDDSELYCEEAEKLGVNAIHFLSTRQALQELEVILADSDK